MTDQQAPEATNPDCDHCRAMAGEKTEAAAMLHVGATGAQHFLCAQHLQNQQRLYDAQLVHYQMVSLVRVPTSAEEKYAEVINDLRAADQKEKELTAERDNVSADVARLQIDNDRLVKMVGHERMRASEMEHALKEAAVQVEHLHRELALQQAKNAEALHRIDELTAELLFASGGGGEPGEAASTEPAGSASEPGGSVVEGSAGDWRR